MKRALLPLAALACYAQLYTYPPSAHGDPPSRDAYLRLATDIETSLQHDVLEKWFPAAVDESHGGFFENYAEDWSRNATRGNDKSIVYQSRLTWLAAKAAERDPAHADPYLKYTRHGVACLSEKLWDRDHGGLFWTTDESGHPTAERGAEKHAYGISFAIYAASASFHATHDDAALDLAKKTFLWLDQHAHDAEHGGYYEALAADGTPILASTTHPTDAIGTRYGYKSMNTHIHLLESLTALHEVWPDDPTVKQRLRELFEIVRDRIYTDPGCLHLYFNPDWRPIPELDSFGHDIETAYLLAEAAAALGTPDDAVAWSHARRLVDHALEFGFDRDHGGFYNEATTFGRDVTKEKIWWVQAEGLNALLTMHERFGRETPRYWEAFERQWSFIRQHQIDPVHGGWYNTVTPEGKPRPGAAKSDRWTEGYHQGRAMMNVIATLRKLQ
jgi:mannobiose 2-epimerase